MIKKISQDLDDVRTWKGLRILIVGYGKEGRATEQYLRLFAPDNSLTILDHTDGSEFISQQMKHDIAIKSPGIPSEVMNIPYTTATNLFFGHVGRSQVIGITGTKGKSTTSSLLAHILSKADWPIHLVGNIGKPALQTLCDLHLGKVNIFAQWYVYELSSYQLSDIRFSPHIALVTSLFPEHMDYHQSIDRYYQAKKNIVVHQNELDYFVYDPKNPQLEQWAAESISKTIPFVDYSAIDTQLLGNHNKKNIAGVVTIARLLQINEQIVSESISSFCPLAHRLELVGTYAGVTFYDDAISTTPESTIAALEALPETQTLFLGGLDRGYDFSELIKKILESNVKNIVLFPQSGKTIYNLLKRAKADCTLFETTSMTKAVEFAFKNTSKGSVCLLSTASPSYSLWKNFEEKGDAYQLAIRSSLYAT